ncbi:hypothetical protein QRD02_05385 [Aequorivita sp. SDUM287046]|uniref:Zinc ribbon domain-containing protein n=1 Tax=Aequorivita aurantiaca TaxID=3053356 RepID=A0ABT8DIS2_9FLAO|nr:hypothetical protein [Aequorivita aurantiaca]MDN3723805.1 hypothetical protein [Aequorivita aurantiaca]
MNSTYKLLILLFLIANTSYAQEWVKTDITDFASIDFPVASELIETGQETVYNARDEVAFYLVSIRKLTDQQTSQITQKDIPTIYQGVVRGALESANAELVSLNEIAIQEFLAVELEYLAQSSPELPSQRFKRVIYLNQNIINIDFWPLTDATTLSNERKATFFNSFTITSNQIAQTSTNENHNSAIYDAGYKTGLLLGQIVFYAILLGFILGIVLLIRYLARKNRKKKTPPQAEQPPQGKMSNAICKNCCAENGGSTKYCSSCGYELTKI